MDPIFKIVLKYGGQFDNGYEPIYRGGFEANLEIQDIDYLSYFDLIGKIRDVNPMLRECMNVEVFYCVPNMSLSEGLREIKLDVDVMEMSGYGVKYGFIEVFVTCVDLDHMDGNMLIHESLNWIGEGSSNPKTSELELSRSMTEEDEDGNEDSDHDSTENESVLSGGASSEDDDEWYSSRTKIKEMHSLLHEKINAVGDREHCCHSNSESDDEYLNSPSRSDEEEEYGSREKVAFKVDSDANLKKLVWRAGMKFSAPEIFKEQVIRYGAYGGYCVRWWKNEKNKKLAAKCKEGCEWKIYASWDGRRESFIVKSCTPTHTCDRQDFENTQVTPRFLAKEYLVQYKKNPSWSRKALQDDVLLKFGKRINRQCCYKVKKYASEILYGSIGDHYKMLGSYLAELKRVDNNINIVLLTNKSEILRAPDVFRRIYVSFPGIREGFLDGCRPIICLDGCFLKTYLGGMLLCAIGRDANNQMYPIAWAVVEAETNNSWSWFLGILKKDLSGFGGGNCTISSDQQKGLCNAVNEHFPNVEHRNCARHIFANWRKKHKGDELKMYFWKAARAYTKADFEIALKDMGMVSKKAVEDLIQKDPTHFCRSHLKTGSKSEVIVNNLAETFNGYILEARSKPLIYMLEDIRLKLMERFFNNSLLMRNQRTGAICPRIKTKLNRAKEEARQCESMRASEAEFQVMHHTDMFRVHIVDKTCSCRKWDLTGIPCCHAISALNSIRVEPEKLVYDWFKKEKYDASYRKPVGTIRGEKHWPKVNSVLDPPDVKIGAGRPKKNRKKDPHERFDTRNKLTKHGLQMTCSTCNGKSHNKRTCPHKGKIPNNGKQAQLAKARGRPRKDGNPPKKITHDPAMPKRKRGRPPKVVAAPSHRGIPNGRGVYFGPNQRTYINPGQEGGIVFSQSSGAPGPTQPSKP